VTVHAPLSRAQRAIRHSRLVIAHQRMQQQQRRLLTLVVPRSEMERQRLLAVEAQLESSGAAAAQAAAPQVAAGGSEGNAGDQGGSGPGRPDSGGSRGSGGGRRGSSNVPSSASVVGAAAPRGQALVRRSVTPHRGHRPFPGLQALSPVFESPQEGTGHGSAAPSIPRLVHTGNSHVGGAGGFGGRGGGLRGFFRDSVTEGAAAAPRRGSDVSPTGAGGSRPSPATPAALTGRSASARSESLYSAASSSSCSVLDEHGYLRVRGTPAALSRSSDASTALSPVLPSGGGVGDTHRSFSSAAAASTSSSSAAPFDFGSPQQQRQHLRSASSGARRSQTYGSWDDSPSRGVSLGDGERGRDDGWGRSDGSGDVSGADRDEERDSGGGHGEEEGDEEGQEEGAEEEEESVVVYDDRMRDRSQLTDYLRGGSSGGGGGSGGADRRSAADPRLGQSRTLRARKRSGSNGRRRSEEGSRSGFSSSAGASRRHSHGPGTGGGGGGAAAAGGSGGMVLVGDVAERISRQRQRALVASEMVGDTSLAGVQRMFSAAGGRTFVSQVTRQLVRSIGVQCDIAHDPDPSGALAAAAAAGKIAVAVPGPEWGGAYGDSDNSDDDDLDRGLVKGTAIAEAWAHPGAAAALAGAAGGAGALRASLHHSHRRGVRVGGSPSGSSGGAEGLPPHARGSAQLQQRQRHRASLTAAAARDGIDLRGLGEEELEAFAQRYGELVGGGEGAYAAAAAAAGGSGSGKRLSSGRRPASSGRQLMEAETIRDFFTAVRAVRQQRSRDSGGARSSGFSSAAASDGAVAVSVDARAGDRSASAASDSPLPTREWRASGSAGDKGGSGVAPRVKRASASAAAAVAAAGRAIRGSVGWGRSSGSARRLQLSGGSAGAERSAVELSTLNPVAAALRASAARGASAGAGDLGIDPRGMRVFLLQQQQQEAAAAAAAQGEGGGGDGDEEGGRGVSLLAADLPAGDAGPLSPSPAVLMAAAGGGRSSIRLLRRLSHQAAARLSLTETLQPPLSASASSRMLLRARASGSERSAFGGSSARNLFGVPSSSAAPAAMMSLQDAHCQQVLTASNRSLTHSTSLQTHSAAASLRRIAGGVTAPSSRRTSGSSARRSRRGVEGAPVAADGAGDRSDSSRGGSGAEGTDSRSDADPDAHSGGGDAGGGGGGCEDGDGDAASGAVGLSEHSRGGGAGGVNPLALLPSPRDGLPDGAPSPGSSGGAASRSARGTRRPTAAVPSGFSQVPLQVIREQRSRVRPSSGAAVANPLLAALYAGAAGSHSSVGSAGSRLSSAAPMGGAGSGGAGGGSNSTLLSTHSSSGGSDPRVVGSAGDGSGGSRPRGGVSSWRPPSGGVSGPGRQAAPAQAASAPASGSLLGALGRWLPFGGRGRVPEGIAASGPDPQRHRRGVSAERAAGFPVMQVGGGRGTGRAGQPRSLSRAGSGGAAGGGLLSRLTGALGWGSGGRGQGRGVEEEDDEEVSEGEADTPPDGLGYDRRSGSAGASHTGRGYGPSFAARSGQVSGGVHSFEGPGGRSHGQSSLALSPQQHQALLAAVAASSRVRERSASAEEAGHSHEGQGQPPSRPHRTTRSDGSGQHDQGAGPSGSGGGSGGFRRTARRSGEGGPGFGRDTDKERERDQRNAQSGVHHGHSSGGEHNHKRRPAPSSGDAAWDSRSRHHHGGRSSNTDGSSRSAAQQGYPQLTAPMTSISEAGEQEDGRSRAATGSSVALSQVDTPSRGASDGSGSPASASPGSPALSASSDASGSPASGAVSATPAQQPPGHRRSVSSGSARSGRAGHRPLSAILELASELSTDHMRLAETDEAALGRAGPGLGAAGADSAGTAVARAWRAQQPASLPAGPEANGPAADGDGAGAELAPPAQAARLSRSSVLRLPSAPAASGVASQRRSVVLVAPPDWLLAAAASASGGAPAAGTGDGLSSGDAPSGSRRGSSGAPPLQPGSILLPAGGRRGHRGSLVAGVSLRPDGTFGLNLGAGPRNTDIGSRSSAETPATSTAAGGVVSHSRAVVAPEADDGMSLGLLPLTLAADEDAAGADEQDDGAW
jgi:hypothetical protein